MKTVLIPVDESDYSIKTVDYAVKHITTDSDEIILLHVRHPIQYPSFPIAERQERYLELEKQESEKAEILMNRLVSKFEDYKMVEVLVREGDPREVILEEYEKAAPDLIIMGCRGSTALKRLIFGSVSRYVLENCSGPVMIVK